MTVSSATAKTSTDASSSHDYRTFNPATGELVRDYATLTDQEADAVLDRAHAAFLAWRSVPLASKVEKFRKLADLFTANMDRLAHQISLEMGKPVAESKFELGLPIQMLQYHAERAEELLADAPVALEGFSKVYTRKDPIGVVLGIEPWNGPIYQAVRAIAPNVMLGNTIIIKPAEITAGSTLILDELFKEAGFPESVYQTALLSRDQVSRYIADPRIRAVTLTGSDRAGAAVAEQAGRHIKPIVLELGGSDPFVVLDSADVAAAASTAATCRLALSGQICISPKRVIVTERVADEFIKLYSETFAS